MPKKSHRLERDSMGAMQVPQNAYWGAQTQRAVENFPISGLRFSRRFIRALGLVKMTAAQTNMELGLLDSRIGSAIVQAAQEVMDGQWDDHFILDVFQTGSGTSTNMNANEVIANRASEILGYDFTRERPIHPNDHVNRSQSSNDVIPTCIHLAALEGLDQHLLEALRELRRSLQSKAEEFQDVIKIGRTHLQDATPMTLGQAFGGYTAMIHRDLIRLENVRDRLGELALGGTAVGTGLNAPPLFAKKVIEKIIQIIGIEFWEAENHFEAQGARDAVVETSAALKTVAVSLMKIANDVRWLGSGPRCGIGELILPEVQPGSSIMPGKVNPVMAEALMQVCAQVIGHDAAITVGALMGNFELNTMMPLLAYNVLQSIEILSNAVTLFDDKLIKGLKADRVRSAALMERSLAMVTALTPKIGYDAAAQIAKEAHASGRTVREVALEKGILAKEELDKILDPWTMLESK